jgi:hypothetical protein
MEYKKKKNKRSAQDQCLFVVIVIVLIMALLFGLGLVAYLSIAPRNDMVFSQTATNLLATNNAVAELIEQTNIAATEQFILTGTALP